MFLNQATKIKNQKKSYNCSMKYLSLILALALLTGCGSKKNEPAVTESKTSVIKIKYAEGFKISSDGNSYVVEVNYPYQGATSGYRYLLVPQGQPVPEHDASVRVVRTPVKKIVCTSTTHIPLLDYLGETNSLVGFPTLDYISSEKTRQRIDAGKVTELGVDKGMNLEQLTVLKPDMVMGYTMSSDYGQFKKVEDLGIPVVINSEYLEKHPLGRAEWIKFVALFFGKEREADSVFNAIERNYLETKLMADSVAVKPNVLSGIVYGDTWFMPGGENYASKILKDAGCNYLWARDSSQGFLKLSFEAVYDRAHNADLWIGTGTFKSLAEIKAADNRYSKFRPFKEKNIYTSNARLGAKGGSEVMELGYLRPDIILKDLVKIGHPQLLEGYQLYFHKKLE
jgi:iron complex transport system substrate-binding protein